MNHIYIHIYIYELCGFVDNRRHFFYIHTHILIVLHDRGLGLGLNDSCGPALCPTIESLSIVPSQFLSDTLLVWRALPPRASHWVDDECDLRCGQPPKVALNNSPF